MVKKDWCLALTRERCLVSIFFWPTSWILLKQLFLSPSESLASESIAHSAFGLIWARGIIVNYCCHTLWKVYWISGNWMLSCSNKELMRNKIATFHHFPLCFHTLLRNSIIIIIAHARREGYWNVPVTCKIVAFVYSFKTTASNNFAHKKGNTSLGPFAICHLIDSQE